MKATRRLFLAAGLALATAQGALAAAAAVVEGVQMPAWVERADGGRAPLAPGMEIRSGEQVRTGPNSRLLLRLSEGSRVKLGENGTLRMDDLRPNEGGTFVAAMKVAEGAFRFTTDIFMKNRPRLVNITVATITTGVRGTDLWGKSDRADRQIVCLIEGKVEVAAPGEAPVTMDQPLQFYRREKGVTQPVGFVDAQQLRQWALETEIAVGQGAARSGGKWKVTLVSADAQQAALAAYDLVRNNGYAAGIQVAKTGDKILYNVRIAGLPSKEEAQALAGRLKGTMGIVEPRVSM